MTKASNDVDTLTIARLTGLDKAVERFPDDVLAGSRAAAQVRTALYPLADATIEPWPPMRTMGSI